MNNILITVMLKMLLVHKSFSSLPHPTDSNYSYLEVRIHDVQFTNACGKLNRLFNNHSRYGIHGECSKKCRFQVRFQILDTYSPIHIY